MIEPEIINPFLTGEIFVQMRNVFAQERYIFAQGRIVFPQSMFIQPENPQLPIPDIPEDEEEEDD